MEENKEKVRIYRIGSKAVVTFAAKADREAFQREIALIGNGNVKLGAIVIKSSTVQEPLKKAV